MPVLSNAKHEAVVQAYVADPQRIAWKAYKSVYPKCSEAAARTAAGRLFKKADISSRIAELQASAADKAVMDLREVLAELSKLGRSNVQDFIVGGDDTAEVIESLRNLKPEHAAAIQELVIDTYVEGAGDDAREVKRVRLKLHDKRGALSELRKHFEPHRVEHTGKDGGPIETKDVSEMSDLEIARRVAFLLNQAARGKQP